MNKQNKRYDSPFVCLIETSDNGVLTASGEVKAADATWNNETNPWATWGEN